MKFSSLLSENVRMIIKLPTKAYLSDVTVANIYESFTPQDGGENQPELHALK